MQSARKAALFPHGRTAAYSHANIALLDRIAAIAAAKGVKPSQLAIAWTIAAGTTPIPGTRRVAYLEENAAASDIGLTEAELASLDAAAPVHAASGDRYSTGMMHTVDV